MRTIASKIVLIIVAAIIALTVVFTAGCGNNNSTGKPPAVAPTATAAPTATEPPANPRKTNLIVTADVRDKTMNIDADNMLILNFNNQEDFDINVTIELPSSFSFGSWFMAENFDSSITISANQHDYRLEIPFAFAELYRKVLLKSLQLGNDVHQNAHSFFATVTYFDEGKEKPHDIAYTGSDIIITAD